MALHLGAGRQILSGYLNCDLHPGAGIDCVFDLCGGWPFEDDVAATVYASHVLEHLPDPLAFFAEMWRVCRPMAQVTLRMPYGGHKAAWWDLTHVRPWFPENFCMLQPGYAESIGNPQHDEWRHPFVVHRVNIRVSGRLRKVLRYKTMRRLVLPRLDYLPNVYEEFWVDLSPLKHRLDVEAFMARESPRYLPARVVMFEHDWAGESAPRFGVCDVRVLGEGVVGIG